MRDECVQGLRQCLPVQVLRQFDVHVLVEVVGPERARVQEPVLDRGERHVPDHRPLLGRDRRRPGHVRGQRGHGLVCEQVTWRQVHAGLPGPGHHLDADDRVAAEGEEVVLDADLRQTEHLRPDVGDDALDIAREGRRNRSAPCRVRAARGGRPCRWRSTAARPTARTPTAPCSRAGSPTGGPATGRRSRRPRRRRPTSRLRTGPAGPGPRSPVRLRARPAPIRSRPVRSGTRASSPARRPGPRTPRHRRAATAPRRRSGTSGRRASRTDRPRTAPPSDRAARGNRAPHRHRR